MPLSSNALGDLVAQETGEAWLTLLSISHESMPEPLRFTSDTVDTLHAGNAYVPFPFSLSLPDNAEGRVPQARLTIDNTTTQIIAVMRVATTPPLVTIRIVRASDPDVVEKEYADIRMVGAQYDVQAITCRLEPAPLEAERVPFMRFDRQFKGLWPS